MSFFYEEFLFESDETEHPFDGIRIGLELEFAFKLNVESYAMLTGRNTESINPRDLEKVYLEKEITEYLQKLASRYFGKVRYIPYSAKDKAKNLLSKGIFVLISDSSIESNTKWKEPHITKGFELVTPIFSAESGEELETKLRNFLETFREFINSSDFLATTPTTALHVNMSHTEKTLKPVHKAILMFMFDTSYMIDSPETRRHFAMKTMDALRAAGATDIPQKLFPEFIKAFERRDKTMFRMLLKEIQKMTSSKKRQFTAATTPRKNYVEFRVIGGEGYEERIDEILEKMKILAKKFKSAFEVEEKEIARKIISKISPTIEEIMNKRGIAFDMKFGNVLHHLDKDFPKVRGFDVYFAAREAYKKHGGEPILAFLRGIREHMEEREYSKARKIANFIVSLAETNPDYGKYREKMKTIAAYLEKLQRQKMKEKFS